MLEVLTDEIGNFSDARFVIADDDSSTRFTLAATGRTPGVTAEAYFADAPLIVVTLDPLLPGQVPNPMKPGGTATFSIRVEVKTGSAFWANLSIRSGLPAGASASLSPNPVYVPGNQPAVSSTLTIATSVATPLGDWPLTIRAEKVGAPSDWAEGIAVLEVRNLDFR
ncbi:MAG: hypothetical protein A2V88_13075 [Elusimicrobia bacterium RBG_16_66_12]|nr:MAG: hypothetical protein A2V88_13075 [Elusimicrobia bacterium RBG_16_66_12]